MRAQRLLALALLATAGCVAPHLAGSHMRLLDARPSHDPANATFVLARPQTPCDNSDRFTVVDETGRFLGESIAGGRFEIELTPGEHTLFAWDEEQVAWARQKYPDYDDAGGIALTAAAGEVRVLIASRPNAPGARGHKCNTLAPIALREAAEDERDVVIEQTELTTAVDAPTIDLRAVADHAEHARKRMRAR